MFADEFDRELTTDGVAHQEHPACVERGDPRRKRVAGFLRVIRLRRGFARAGQMRHQHVEPLRERVILVRKGIQRGGSVVFDYGNNIRLQGKLAGVADSFDFPGYIPAFIRKMFCEGRGPCRWVALSGDPADIYKIDEVILERFPQDHRTCRWLDFVQDHIMFAGLPARTCWLDF